ncbi:MAG: DUF493 domain-containing protein [Gammaproteobacteria bacterium]|nr:DUF493 domain-containing protein [Gammaproteobacteria bacterium]
MSDLHTDETIFEFPCPFPIKAMGKNTPEFESFVMGVINKHVADLGEGAVSSKPSKGDKWISLTITITAQSKAHLDAIYLELNGSDLVVMTL